MHQVFISHRFHLRISSYSANQITRKNLYVFRVLNQRADVESVCHQTTDRRVVMSRMSSYWKERVRTIGTFVYGGDASLDDGATKHGLFISVKEASAFIPILESPSVTPAVLPSSSSNLMTEPQLATKFCGAFSRSECVRLDCDLVHFNDVCRAYLLGACNDIHCTAAHQMVPDQVCIQYLVYGNISICMKASCKLKHLSGRIEGVSFPGATLEVTPVTPSVSPVPANTVVEHHVVDAKPPPTEAEGDVAITTSPAQSHRDINVEDHVEEEPSEHEDQYHRDQKEDSAMKEYDDGDNSKSPCVIDREDPR